MRVISVNIGEKKEVEWNGKIYTTGIFKKPVLLPIFLGEEDVQGDAVIDRRYHGGIDQAVYAYGKNHYAYWQELYPNLEIKEGFFGENLTLSNLNEEEIHVGDIFKLGETIIEVTKPRQPCVKLGICFQDAKVVKQFWNTTKCGVYFKVLQTGFVSKNDTLTLIKKGENTPSIAQIFVQKRQRS
ncbi:uncharacterized protein UJ101_01212 [Flavobacteriaceae bacterium UJ101]|nr:uncharacterized protein UJ101_01212 [Flavobacteriaceae bacterium UJ101]